MNPETIVTPSNLEERLFEGAEKILSILYPLTISQYYYFHYINYKNDKIKKENFLKFEKLNLDIINDTTNKFSSKDRSKACILNGIIYMREKKYSEAQYYFEDAIKYFSKSSTVVISW